MHMLSLGNSWNSVFTVSEFTWHPHMTSYYTYDYYVPLYIVLCAAASILCTTDETLFEILEPSIV